MADKPKKKEIYACHHGDYAGQSFVFINEEELSYNFLRIPDMANISIPGDVYKVIQAQYKKNENTDN